MRLFLDANVLFTAAYSPDGRSRALFRLAAAGYCTLQTSPHALAEARRNLSLKAGAEAVTVLDNLIGAAELVGEADVRLVTWARELDLPPNDAPILAAAVGAQADLLVTGDRRHFGRWIGSVIGSVTVATPADALAAVLSEVEGPS